MEEQEKVGRTLTHSVGLRPMKEEREGTIGQKEPDYGAFLRNCGPG